MTVVAKTVRAVVDRIEECYAVVLLGDQGHHLDWPLEYLPECIREGMLLSFTIEVDSEATTAAEDEIESLIDRLKHRE